jgi:hypothetical protein
MESTHFAFIITILLFLIGIGVSLIRDILLKNARHLETISDRLVSIEQSLVTIEESGGNDGHHSDIEYLMADQSPRAFDEVDDK